MAASFNGRSSTVRSFREFLQLVQRLRLMVAAGQFAPWRISAIGAAASFNGRSLTICLFREPLTPLGMPRKAEETLCSHREVEGRCGFLTSPKGIPYAPVRQRSGSAPVGRWRAAVASSPSQGEARHHGGPHRGRQSLTIKFSTPWRNDPTPHGG